VSQIQIVFTSGETADQWISDRVRQSPHPQSLVVVSNDLGIRFDIRGTGARFLTADQFLKGPKPAASRSPTTESQPPAAEEITEEFKKKWL
jgi:predicted RNA-binding protein with PIN domain